MSAWALQDLHDGRRVTEQLVGRQLSEEAAGVKAGLFSDCATALLGAQQHGQSQAFVGFVPGRIEVLGKHTDYPGGRSMVVAVEQGFCVVSVPRSDRAVRVTDAQSGEQTEFLLTADLVPRAGHWSNYPMTAARRIARNFPGDLKGAEIAFASDLPPAAGMSSSSALIIASFLALSAASELSTREPYIQNVHSPEDLAGYLGTVENGQSFGTLTGDRGVGTFGGSEDHTAILCARSGKIVQYSYCPVRFERAVSLPDDHVFALACSGVVAEKTGAAMDLYNRVSLRASAAIELWRQATGRDDPHLAAALQSAPDAADRFRELLHNSKHPIFGADELSERFEQFEVESEQIIPSVPDTLAGPAIERFGELVDRSQSQGARCLGNQVPETVWLADQARQLGAAAASAFGAGFGGSVWALVDTDRAQGMIQEWSKRYQDVFPQCAAKARFWTTHAGPPAFLLE